MNIGVVIVSIKEEVIFKNAAIYSILKVDTPEAIITVILSIVNNKVNLVVEED